MRAVTNQIEDHTLRTTNWISASLTKVIDPTTGMTEADLVLGTLQAATVPRIIAAYISMTSVGIDLADPQVQAMIPLIGAAGKWPENLIKTILESGVRVTYPFVEVTAEACKQVVEADNTTPDSTSHELLLSVNRQHDGTQQIVVRVTPVELLEGVVLRRGDAATVVNVGKTDTEKALIAAIESALSAFVGGL